MELYDNHDHLSIGEHEEHMNGSSDLQARIEKEIVCCYLLRSLPPCCDNGESFMWMIGSFDRKS